MANKIKAIVLRTQKLSVEIPRKVTTFFRGKVTTKS
jgi:hypothetical protein